MIFGDQKRAIARKPRKMGLEPVIQGVDPSGPVKGGANDNHVVPFPYPHFQKKKKLKKEKKENEEAKANKQKNKRTKSNTVKFRK